MILRYDRDTEHQFDGPGYGPVKDRDTDLGIDIPSAVGIAIAPNEIAVVDSGLRFEFPIFGSIHRFLIKKLLGIEVTGIGGLLWPRSRSDYAVLAGVIDAGYRGQIKVKIHNTTEETITIAPGDYIAQLVPTLTLHTPILYTGNIDTNTDRGSKGGINEVRK